MSLYFFREKRLKEEQKQQEHARETQVLETKQERKMREKMERVQLKIEERERKKREREEERERKELQRENKRREADRRKNEKERESMGLSNIIGYQDIDFSKPGARAQADFIDTATASLF